MNDVNKLIDDELSALNNDEVFDLEALITDGADARVPVKITFPKQEPDGTIRMVQAGAMIRPLTNLEWNNAVRKKKQGLSTTDEVELLKMALYTMKGEQMPSEVVEKIPNGVTIELVKEVARISGVDIEANLRLARDIVGFSI